MLRIQNEEDYNNFIKLLEQICKKLKLTKEEIGNEDYHYEFRTDEELIKEVGKQVMNGSRSLLVCL